MSNIKKNCPSCFVLHRPTECPSQVLHGTTVTKSVKPATLFRGELFMTTTPPKRITCAFCHAENVSDLPPNPIDKYWQEQAAEHKNNCAWVNNRAWSTFDIFASPLPPSVFDSNIKWDTLPITNWPADRRLPSTEEFEAAKQRYLARVEKAGIDNLFCGGDFDRVMSTFSSSTWLHFFFPDGFHDGEINKPG